MILGVGLVDDWRNSDHAWVASTSALYRLDATVTAIGDDDALRATWYPFQGLRPARRRNRGRRTHPVHRAQAPAAACPDPS
ncbi:hypothetical protein [Streptomyces parvus]|uniref:hypothetical protein n=1 Tax=Streptomyces parvus TaxID=66428 RepID=UPI0019410B64|nr:hypothetical protein [Streptomyces parvus]